MGNSPEAFERKRRSMEGERDKRVKGERERESLKTEDGEVPSHQLLATGSSDSVSVHLLSTSAGLAKTCPSFLLTFSLLWKLRAPK
jgi:hypothetical protein